MRVLLPVGTRSWRPPIRLAVPLPIRRAVGCGRFLSARPYHLPAHFAVRLSRPAKIISGLILLVVPTIMYGGVTLLGLLTQGTAGLPPDGLDLNETQSAPLGRRDDPQDRLQRVIPAGKQDAYTCYVPPILPLSPAEKENFSAHLEVHRSCVTLTLRGPSRAQFAVFPR